MSDEQRRVAIFQALPAGTGLFIRPAALSFAHVEQLHSAHAALLDEKTVPAGSIGIVLTGPRVIAATVRALARSLLYGLAGMLLLAAVLLVRHVNALPDLHAWHTLELRDFTYTDSSITDFDAYVEMEERLFREVLEEAYLHEGNARGQRYNRFFPGSLSDPAHHRVNWNRSFELAAERPVAAFLMLHGMSDSPYSMRALAERLHARGVHVLAMRLPGHGTIPSGLKDVDWRDFAAAVRLGAAHLEQRAGPDVPFYIAGYSNGGALAVEYALEAMENDRLRRPDGLLLLSPALGVSPLAVFASFTLLASELPGLDKLAWLSIQPEFDPYKYNSFAVNAGEQVYRLTEKIAERMRRLDRGQGIEHFPPVLAFKSAADATVPPDTLVSGLFDKLAPNGHHLVLYDVNRQSDTDELLVNDPAPLTRRLLDSTLDYDFTLLGNRDDSTLEVVAREKKELDPDVRQYSTGLQWPTGIYSSSHVALPFSPDDPVYGATRQHSDIYPPLGALQLRGERGLLVVPIGQLMRLRYNPFFEYQQALIEKEYFPDDLR